MKNSKQYRTKNGKDGIMYFYDIKYRDSEELSGGFCSVKLWACNDEQAEEFFWQNAQGGEEWDILSIEKIFYKK